ncbi:hypothetical protein DVH24_024321 [Malus domestica]|uniref:Uncharacterized protein n=1 Tax=Malus domestica TaxID=3750 RepID=A0A498JIG9_MALDO|nr:hypothetical protein DVH24_024321 [Malus domestica]
MASFPQPEDDSVPTTGSTRPFDDDGWLRPQTLLPVIRLRVAQGLRHGFPNLPRLRRRRRFRHSPGVGCLLSSVDLRRIKRPGL